MNVEPGGILAPKGRRPDVKVKYAFDPKFYTFIFMENCIHCGGFAWPDGAIG